MKVLSNKVKQHCLIAKNICDMDKTLLDLWSIQPVETVRKPLRNARAA